MNKIPCLFERVFSPKGKVVSISATVTPGCEWVANGEGIATRKYDGTACAVIKGRLYKRLDIKNLNEPPPGWIPCARLDGKAKPGWFPVGEGPEDRYHREGWVAFTGIDGTYELCGPKLQGNPEQVAALKAENGRLFVRVGMLSEWMTRAHDYLGANPPADGWGLLDRSADNERQTLLADIYALESPPTQHNQRSSNGSQEER